MDPDMLPMAMFGNFLDHRLVEYAFTIPSNLKISSDAGKSIVRNLLKDKFPNNNVQQAKKSIVLRMQEIWQKKECLG